MHYLMIENPGEAPIEGLLLQGATTKDPTRNDQVIGMFGSGTKYAVLALLRGSVYPIITTGLRKLEWDLRPLMIGTVEHKEVFVRVDSRASRPTGSVLNSGQSDWKANVQLALREFVSNALDEVGGDKSQVHWEINDKVRCRKGYTRVFIPWAADGHESFRQFLQTWFLHFRNDKQLSQFAGPIPKINPESRAYFYRRGVLIRQFSRNEPSLWDYNFIHLDLDEARNADDWKMQYEASRLLASHPDKLVQTIHAITDRPHLWEAKLSEYGLSDGIRANVETIRASFQNLLFAPTVASAELAQRKGIQTQVIPSNWYSALNTCSIPTVENQLSEWITKGVEELTTIEPKVLDRANYWESRIQACNLSSTRGPAPVRQFYQHPSAVSKLYGFCDSKGIGLNKELGTEGELLDRTILEELCHWHSGCKDFTREFQEWIIRFALRNSSCQSMPLL